MTDIGKDRGFGEGVDLTDLRNRVDALEARVFGAIPQPAGDGWITNGYPSDEATIAMLTKEYGTIYQGQPKATPQKTAAVLKAGGIVGFYAGTQRAA